MRLGEWMRSIGGRFVAVLLAAGVVLSLGWALIAYPRALVRSGDEAAEHARRVAEGLRQTLEPIAAAEHTPAIQAILQLHVDDPLIGAARVTGPGGTLGEAGTWPTHAGQLAYREHRRSAQTPLQPLSLDRRTVWAATLDRPVGGGDADASGQLQLLLDGPALRRAAVGDALANAATVWVVLGALTLGGIVLMRLWFAAPLARIDRLIAADAPARDFEAAGADSPGEFGRLAGSIAAMLRRIDRMTATLRQREQAFEDLYQFAPVAMLSVGPTGRITEANDQAARLFGVEAASDLLDRPLVNAVTPNDRAAFREAVDRLGLDERARCELQMHFEAGPADVDMQLAAVRDDEDSRQLARVRISLLDVSRTRQLVRDLDDQRWLLDLVINHMSDGVLLLGPDGRVATINRQLCRMLSVEAQTVRGQAIDAGGFWAALGLDHAERFAERFDAARQSPAQPWGEQVEAASGTYHFHAVPVSDRQGGPAGQMWVVEDVTAQVASRRLSEIQQAQLQALLAMGKHLSAVAGRDDLLERVAAEVRQVVGAEAVGLALRGEQADQRSRQIVSLDGRATHLEAGRATIQAVQAGLMPAVFAGGQACMWADLSTGPPWCRPLADAGLEALAASPVINAQGVRGVLWIGRRGGQPIERRHLDLLQTLGPMVATALHGAELADDLRELALTDPVTGLPSFKQFDRLAGRVARAGRSWSMLMLDIDRFRAVNEQLGATGANEVLRAVAEVLRAALRSADQPIRHSADRFVIICPATSGADARSLAERIRADVAAMRLGEATGAGELTLNCSIGVAASDLDGAGANLLLELAEQRLHTAKAAGRNRTVYPEPRGRCLAAG